MHLRACFFCYPHYYPCHRQLQQHSQQKWLGVDKCSSAYILIAVITELLLSLSFREQSTIIAHHLKRTQDGQDNYLSYYRYPYMHPVYYNGYPLGVKMESAFICSISISVHARADFVTC